MAALPFARLTSATRGFCPSLLLGSGATGDVFRGVLDGAPVAVKRLNLPPSATPEAREFLSRRFHAELRTLSTYRHARIVRLLGHASDGDAGHPFAIVLELLEGGSLSDWLRGPQGEAAGRSHPDGAPLTALERCDIALGVAAGLSYLHGLREVGKGAGPAGVTLHRDVKAANIGLARVGGGAAGGGSLYAKLLDCGLAKALRGEGVDMPAASYGSTSITLGTPGYMAPELANTGASVATEVYALGVVLAELLIGARATPDLAITIARECRRDNTHLAARAEGVWPRDAAAALATLVVDCTKQFDDERPTSAAVVMLRLHAVRALINMRPPLLGCVVCEERVSVEQGAHCNDALRHFVCAGCVNGISLVDAGYENVRELGGAVRCPWRGAIGAGVVETCLARWTLEDEAFARVLEMGTWRELARAAQAALRVRPPPPQQHEHQQPPDDNSDGSGAPPPLPSRAERIGATVAALMAVHPPGPGEGGILLCPGCAFPFVDYVGCGAVKCGCGTHFCVLCLKTFPNAGSTHAHFLEPPRGQAAHRGVGNGYDVSVAEFSAFHTAARWVALRRDVDALEDADATWQEDVWHALGGGAVRTMESFVMPLHSDGSPDFGPPIEGSIAVWRAAHPNALIANVQEGYDIVDADFVHFRGLRALDMSGCDQITDSAFVHLAGIHTLDMRDCTQITDAAFVHLRGIHALNMSRCHQDTITDAAFVHLRGIHTLVMMSCNQESITDAAFVHLRGIHTLDMLGCNQESITDAAFVHLRGIHTLDMCGCNQTGISDSAFMNLRGIHTLYMEGCNQVGITDITIQELRRCIPDFEYNYDCAALCARC